VVRVSVDGKQFLANGERFHLRGVTYGTFRPRDDGARFPEFDRVKRDFEAMSEAGFNVVRTYTAPPDDVVSLAADWGLRLLAGVFYPDWRYLVGASRRDRRQLLADAGAEVRTAARRLRGQESVMGLCLGNEVPADVIRWLGTDTVAGALGHLVEVAREEDPAQLLTYANYPTAEYLQVEGLDFLTFNVFLERREEFAAYLNRLHSLAGERPVILGEVGFDSGGNQDGEGRQAATLDWALGTAMERGLAGTCVFSWTDEWWVGDAAVEGWHFGLTRADRSPKPALGVVADWNSRTVSDVRDRWPSLSVVICAYNAAGTIDECLAHTCALDYPALEVIVVDDGSDDDTAAIAARHPRARLVEAAHHGLSVARNEGYQVATGELVAYLDSDAYPSAEWPYYLALGFGSPALAGMGGPNVAPVGDPMGAHQVARAPGGPQHVLVHDDRAEHVPGCNMAFRRDVLCDVGGFDPVYTAAGDDVDFCWRVLDAGGEIGFHPAALVWHHRRPGLGSYLRQQRGYGRAEALVEARHPHRFTSSGSARWTGRIYGPASGGTAWMARQRVYRGLYGTGAYQSVYQGGGHFLDLAHQLGVPAAAAVLGTAPLGLLRWPLGVPALMALVFLAVVFGIDVTGCRPPTGAGRRFRYGVGAMCLLQPIVRSWARARARKQARLGLDSPPALPAPVKDAGGGVLLLAETGPRAELAATMLTVLRRNGIRVSAAGPWEDYDALLFGSSLVVGELVTSAHPQGSVQVRVRRRLRWGPAALVLGVAGLVALVQFTVGALVLAAAGAEVARGMWCTGARARQAVRAAAR